MGGDHRHVEQAQPADHRVRAAETAIQAGIEEEGCPDRREQHDRQHDVVDLRRPLRQPQRPTGHHQRRADKDQRPGQHHPPPEGAARGRGRFNGGGNGGRGHGGLAGQGAGILDEKDSR